MIIYVFEILIRVYTGHCHPTWLQFQFLVFVQNFHANFWCGLSSKFELLIYCDPTSKFRQNLFTFINFFNLFFLDRHEFRLSKVSKLAIFSHFSQIHKYFWIGIVLVCVSRYSAVIFRQLLSTIFKYETGFSKSLFIFQIIFFSFVRINRCFQ